MSADDEKALTWDEVSDPTHTAGSRVEPVETEPAATERAEPVETATDTPAETKPPTNSFLLVSYGILAGAYLLYTVEWVLGIGHVNATNPDTLSRIMGVVIQVLAIAAPAIWFGGTFVLTRRRKPILRLLLLLAGLVVTLPLPFIILAATT